MSTKPPLPDKNKDAAKYAQYGGMAFQFLGATLAGVFLGKYLDEKMHNTRPFWAVGLCVLFLMGSFYSIFKQLLQNKP